MKRLLLDDLRTGDRIRISTANSTYEILVVASEWRLGEICGGQIDAPLLVRLTGAAIDVGHEFGFTTVTARHGRREVSGRVIATSAVASIEITPRMRPDWSFRAVAACRRLRLIAAANTRRWWCRVRFSRPADSR